MPGCWRRSPTRRSIRTMRASHTMRRWRGRRPRPAAWPPWRRRTPSAWGRCARPAGLEGARIDTEISLGLAHGHEGRRAASAVLARALADARAAGLHVQTIRAYVNRVVVAADAREHATVDAVSREAMSVFDDY